jgi:hypothetical protein
MASENDLMNKLLISKKIMERHNDMGRNGKEEMISNHNSPVVENYEPVNANYNLPQEFMMESNREIPNPQVPTQDRILNSKLPDEIKKLMLEHPIEQPGMGQGASISNELVEKASRLMGTTPKKEQVVSESKKQERQPSFNSNEMRNLIKETVEDVLKENGLLVESTTRSDEVFKFRVGNHIFEGKLTKIKKIQK